MPDPSERGCGVIYLGASRFPYKRDLDKLSFAKAKEAVAAVLTPDYLLTKDVISLDLFDKEITPLEVVDQVSTFLTDYPDLSELIIYYCGHGGILPGPSFYLTLRSTREGREATTGLSLKQFRLDLDDLLLNKRIYLVLDCCYAAAAVDAWQAEGAVKQLIGDDVESNFPPRGTALLAAASRKTPALAPDDNDITLFSGHFVDAIRAGANDARKELSFADIAENVYKRIRNEPLSRKAMPEMHVPRQTEGDVSRLPFVKNVQAVRKLPSAASVEAGVSRRPRRRKAKRSRRKEAAASPAGLPQQEARPTGGRLVGFIAALSGRVPSAGSIVRGRRPAYAALGCMVVAALAFYGSSWRGSWPTVVAPDRPQNPVDTSSPHSGPSQSHPTGKPPATTAEKSGGGSTAAGQPTPLARSNAASTASYCGDPAGDGAQSQPMGGPLVAAKVAISPNMNNAAELRAVALAPDQSRIATAGDDGRIRLWDADSFKLVSTLPRGTERLGAIYSLDFAYLNSSLLLASTGIDGSVRVWNADTGQMTHKFDVPSGGEPVKQYGAAFLPRINPSHVYTAGEDGVVRKWNLQQSAAETSVAIGTDFAAIRTLSLAPDRRGRFVTGSWAGHVTFASDAGSGKSFKAFSRLTLRVSYSPDGKYVVAAGRDDRLKNLKLWNAETENVVRSFDGHKGYVVSVAWSSDSKKIASGGGNDKLDTTVRIWDVESDTQPIVLAGHTADVEALLFARNDSRLVTVSEDKTLRVWDVAARKELMTLVTFRDDSYVAYTPDGCYSGPPGGERQFKASVNGQDRPLDAALKSALFNPKGFAFLSAR